MKRQFHWVTSCTLATATVTLVCGADLKAPPGSYRVSWLGNSFPGASNRWVQNFFIHTQVQPDGTVNTWSHCGAGMPKQY